MKIGSSTAVSDIRRMRINAIRATASSQNSVSHHDVQFLLDELARAESKLKEHEPHSCRENLIREGAEFASNFLRMSIGSAEWESLRTVARNILARSRK